MMAQDEMKKEVGEEGAGEAQQELGDQHPLPLSLLPKQWRSAEAISNFEFSQRVQRIFPAQASPASPLSSQKPL